MTSATDSGCLAFERVATTDLEVLRLYAEFIVEADAGLSPEHVPDPDPRPPADLEPPHGVLLLARVGGEPAGIAGVRHLDTDVAEVKSMYVDRAHRGRGLGRRLLEAVEGIAAERGCARVRLDTSDYLREAIGLYRTAGYREVPDYNGNAKASMWFERALGALSGD